VALPSFHIGPLGLKKILIPLVKESLAGSCKRIILKENPSHVNLSENSLAKLSLFPQEKQYLRFEI
jgi:hypothetical protein